MYYSIRGKVSKIESKFLVIENCGIGYEVFVAKPDNYIEGSFVSLFIYHHIKEDSEFLVGFNDLKEKEAFKMLLHVNGIGPKGALTILSTMSINQLLLAISENNSELIENVSGISSKIASQIILDLKCYISKFNIENNKYYSEVREALKRLKFKVKEIDKVLPYVYTSSGTKEDMLKEALRRLQNVTQR